MEYNTWNILEFLIKNRELKIYLGHFSWQPKWPTFAVLNFKMRKGTLYISCNDYKENKGGIKKRYFFLNEVIFRFKSLGTIPCFTIKVLPTSCQVYYRKIYVFHRCRILRRRTPVIAFKFYTVKKKSVDFTVKYFAASPFSCCFTGICLKIVFLEITIW